MEITLQVMLISKSLVNMCIRVGGTPTQRTKHVWEEVEIFPIHGNCQASLRSKEEKISYFKNV